MCEGVSDQVKWCCPTWTSNLSWSPGTVTSFTLVTWFMMWHGFSFCWYYVWYLFTVVHGCWQRGIVIAGTSIHPMVDPGLLLLSNSCSTLFSISWSALLDKGEQSVQLASLNFGQRKMLACVLIIGVLWLCEGKVTTHSNWERWRGQLLWRPCCGWLIKDNTAKIQPLLPQQPMQLQAWHLLCHTWCCLSWCPAFTLPWKL